MVLIFLNNLFPLKSNSGLQQNRKRTVERKQTGSMIILGFDAEHSDEQPDKDFIRLKVEQSWDALS